MFFVYLLKSKVDGKYYIGQTNNIEERLGHHNNGFVSSTKHRRPLILVGFERFDSRNKARFREHQLKKNSNERTKFYRKLEKDMSP